MYMSFCQTLLKAERCLVGCSNCVTYDNRSRGEAYFLIDDYDSLSVVISLSVRKNQRHHRSENREYHNR